MADIAIRARVTLPYQTGLATDVAVNDFCFNGDPTVDDILDLGAAIRDFYIVENSAAGHQKALGEYLDEAISRAVSACRIDFFEQGVAGPPFETMSFTMPANTGTGQFPSEVAVCLSFHADYTGLDSVQRARRRGRVYLGPLDRTTGVNSGLNAYRVSEQFIADVLNAAEEFLDDAALAAGFDWAVYSPTASASYAVVQASMDNAFDTLRSRGMAPTARTPIVIG